MSFRQLVQQTAHPLLEDEQMAAYCVRLVTKAAETYGR